MSMGGRRLPNRYTGPRLSKGKVIAICIAAVLVYVGVVFGVQAIGNKIETAGTVEAVGSLDGRFTDTTLTMQYNNRAWMYRKRSLTNILLMGVDWEELDETTERYAGQADFLLLITIDQKNKTVSAIQLDRDTMTDVRIYGPFGNYTGTQTLQICLSHAYGTSDASNCENTVWAVSNLLQNIPIDGYIALDMSAITILNDTLGGVTVTLEDDLSSLDPAMTKGATLTLKGKQAEYFARSRMSIGDGTNSGRMRRQREFIRSAEDLLMEKINSDTSFVGKIYDALDGHMITNLDRGWLMNKAYICSEYEHTDTQTLLGSHSIGEDGFMEFYPDQDALKELVATNFFE